MRRILVALLFLVASLTPTARADQQPAQPVVASLRIEGFINDETVKSFEQHLVAAAAANAQTVRVLINSPGGEVDAGMRIARYLERIPVPVTCIVDGEAASMAFIILQSCQFRVATARATLMTHEPLQMVTTDTYLTMSRMRELLDELRVLSAMFEQHLLARAKVSRAEYRRHVVNRNWWMTPEEALAAGFIDVIIDSPNASMRR